MSENTLWTVPHLPECMDTLWTTRDKWTNQKGCPQAAHPLLGQVIKRTSDLTTAAWITAHTDIAVNHTDHNDNGDLISIIDRTQEIDWTKSENSLTNYVRKIPVDRRGKTLRRACIISERGTMSRVLVGL